MTEVTVDKLIAALKRLPMPERPGQIHVQMVPGYHWPDPQSAKGVYEAVPVQMIKVRAEVFARGSDRWLEWMIEVEGA